MPMGKVCFHFRRNNQAPPSKNNPATDEGSGTEAASGVGVGVGGWIGEGVGIIGGVGGGVVSGMGAENDRGYRVLPQEKSPMVIVVERIVPPMLLLK